MIQRYQNFQRDSSLEGGMDLVSWLVSPLLAKMAGPPCTAHGRYKAKKKLHWRVNKETGKGECQRLGYRVCALTLPKYLAEPKDKCQRQNLSSLHEDTIAEHSWLLLKSLTFNLRTTKLNY